MLIRKLQEYYRLYLTIKFPNEFGQCFNNLSKSLKKSTLFDKYLPSNYASEDNNKLDFEELIIHTQYWDNYNAAHTITSQIMKPNKYYKIVPAK